MDEHPQSIRDHDLLIRLDQKVDALSVDIKDLKDNVAARVSSLELQKADKHIVDAAVKDLKEIKEQIIPSIKYRMAYWSGGIALAFALAELYLHSRH